VCVTDYEFMTSLTMNVSSCDFGYKNALHGETQTFKARTLYDSPSGIQCVKLHNIVANVCET